MRGNMWMVAVVAVFLGLLLPAVSGAGGDGSTTTQLQDVFAPFGEILGLFLLVVCAGAFINWFSGGGL